jgi:hypothetical protein
MWGPMGAYQTDSLANTFVSTCLSTTQCTHDPMSVIAVHNSPKRQDAFYTPLIGHVSATAKRSLSE